MARYANHVSTRKTSQREKASKKQKKNSAGGYSFVLNKWASLDRWLILGADGGTYYASESKLTKDNAKTITSCLDEDGPKTVARIAEISDSGRAPKNDPAIFALAMAAGHSDEATRKAALEALPKVCRTGTHLFQFVDAVRNFRGWGRALRRAVSKWYTDRKSDNLAYQVLKYPSRKLDPKDRSSVMSHRDVLRLAGGAIGPRPIETDAVLRYVVSGMEGLKTRKIERRNGGKRTYASLSPESLPRIVHGWEAMKKANTAKEAAKLVEEYRLPRELVLNQFLSSPEVLEALLPNMPMTALIRNLGNLSSSGVLSPLSDASKMVSQKITNQDLLRQARIHPLNILVALNTYKAGRGFRGSKTWDPVPQVVDALDEAFYLAFKFIEPTRKKRLIALDVSGSMTWSNINGMPGITPSIGSAAMAMTTVRTEENYHVVAFSSSRGSNDTRIRSLNISKRMRLDSVMQKVGSLPFGGTDCALPMVWALHNKVKVDAFEIYTDNETWAGNIHPHQALNQYRQKMGRPAKLSVIGMTATNFSIANPDDPGMLDVVGFDAATPRIISDFIREGFGPK